MEKGRPRMESTKKPPEAAAGMLMKMRSAGRIAPGLKTRCPIIAFRTTNDNSIAKTERIQIRILHYKAEFNGPSGNPG